MPLYRPDALSLFNNAMSSYFTKDNLIDVVVPAGVAYGYYGLPVEKSLGIGAGYLAGRLIAPSIITMINKDTKDSANTAMALANYGPAAGGLAGAALVAAYLDGVDWMEGAICGAVGAVVCMIVNKY
jgi:hypothetical protein